jgi:phage baseplate assembly protein W
MANGKYININYPFKDSGKGFFLDLNDEDSQAVKADLLHLILTRRGQRLYKPDFGTDLLKFIFEPEDGLTMVGIKEEIYNVVKTYLPQLQIDELSIVESDEDEYAAVVTIKYSITDAVFTTTDMVVVKL